MAADSTATVIGAMIVAPLSTPILGAGLGIATGRGALVARSLLYVLAGMVLVIGLGFVVAQVLPDPTNVLTNSQVVGRTSPTLMDLLAALATGLVGSIAITRRDVGDVLPGVAIAISLVPPLGVVGVCLGSGAPSLALGAAVLFATNVLAMIITATVVLTAAGYSAQATAGRRRAYAVLVVALVVVAIPMVINSLSSLWAKQVSGAAVKWLGATEGAEVLDTTIQGDKITVTVLGPAELPPLDELQRSADAILPWHADVTVVHNVGGLVH